MSEAGPLLVQLHAQDPSTVTPWPDWPARAAYMCAAPGVPACADTEEEALSRFLAGQRDLPVRPRQVERLWRLIHLAGLAERPPAAVVPQPLLDADTRAAAARQLFAARRTPELARAAQDAVVVVGSAERLVAASPYRHAVTQIAARRPHALPAMSASLALVARISARGEENCRSFERA